MFRKTFPLIALTFACAFSCFGQKTEINKETLEKPCEPAKINNPQQNSQIAANIGFPPQNFSLKTLVPENAEAWVVEIVTTGGFSGQGLPTILLTSNGDLFVEGKKTSRKEGFSAAQEKLKTDVLREISKIIYAQKTLENDQKTAANIEPISEELKNLCSDCYQTSITVARRDASGEIQFFTNRSKIIFFSIGDFNRIHRVIMDNLAVLN